MHTETRCAFRGCDGDGVVTPNIIIPRRDDDPMTIILEIKVCHRCRLLPIRAFLSDDGFRHLTQILRRHGYDAPDPGQLKLQFEGDEGVVLPTVGGTNEVKP